MRLIDELISRLETRRMSVAGLRCMWCSVCLRVSTRDPQVKKSFELLCAGEDDCRQLMQDGAISECIADLRREAAEREVGRLRRTAALTPWE